MKCPYCHQDLGWQALLHCVRCQTPLHAECAALHGGCVTFGCQSERLLNGPPTSPAELRLRASRRQRLRRGLRAGLSWGGRLWEDPALLLFGLAGLLTWGLLA